MFLKSLAEGLRGPVEGDGDGDEGKAVQEAHGEELVVDRLKHVLAQPADAHHRGHDDHRERHHDGLVDAGHQRRQRQRQLHIPQLLPGRGTEGVRGLDHLLVDEPDPEVGQPDHRRRGVDHHGNQPGHLADAEDHHDRDQVDKARQGLHHVEKRHDPPLCPVGTCRDNADRQPEHDRDQCRHGHHRQGGHGVFPQPEKADREQRGAGAEGDLHTARGEPDGREDQHEHHEPGCPGEDGLERVEKPLQWSRCGVDLVGELAHEVAEPVVDCLAHQAQAFARQGGEIAQGFRQAPAG
ncbi:hypothetical protein SDC9_19870 [bioreactor metagenome]|uniref:Uncharacterized protein n=1 Tax=bioreactor metagenome TaxID=1076179 RepID=A0A644U571_9ZZZZ